MLFIATYSSTSQLTSSNQRGFRKLHSCDSQLLTTIKEFSQHFDTGAQIYTILLDFSKAFDKVATTPDQRLFLKLAYYGIQGSILE